jgi:hypothetical protein
MLDTQDLIGFGCITEDGRKQFVDTQLIARIYHPNQITATR